MRTKPVTITLTLSSSLFQKLAATLQRQGMLRRVLSLDRDDLEIFDPNGEENLKLVHRYAYYKRVHRIFWGIWRRLPGSRLSSTLPAVFLNALADWLFSRWIPSSTIYHGCTGICLFSMKKAKRLGAITLIENATMHARDWQKAVIEECNAFGVRRRDCRAVLPSLLIWRLDREYERCDYIIVPSSIARRSFESAGLHEKAIVVNAGVDHHFFTPPAVFERHAIFRVCYVGRVELAKGVPYLLKAWKQLDLANAELVLIGEIAQEMNSVIKEYALPNVRFAGSLPSSQVAECYRASHLFAFPSVNEGLARVLFEAMASGLPVVATEKSGAEDLITRAVDGTIVPARDAAALAEGILWHFRNPQASAAMGKAARAKVEQQFTLAHYEERMIGVYRFVAGKEPASAHREHLL
jgi:glycosyltransferase involved in cell wall biosynthesis